MIRPGRSVADFPRQVVRDDPLSAPRGLVVGALLAVPVWCCIAGVIWWAYATGVVRL